jgi:hypothetical protein
MGVDNQIVTNSPPCGEGVGVGQKQYYATYVNYTMYHRVQLKFTTTDEKS